MSVLIKGVRAEVNAGETLVILLNIASLSLIIYRKEKKADSLDILRLK